MVIHLQQLLLKDKMVDKDIVILTILAEVAEALALLVELLAQVPVVMVGLE